MPTLPTWESSQNINASPAGVERHQAARPFKDLNNVIDTITDVTQKLSDANDVMQYTKAKTNATKALALQEQAAQNDPNPDNAEEHLKALQEIEKNTVTGIDNQAVANKARLEIEQESFLTGMKINATFKKKQMFANDQKLDDLSTTAAQNKANAVTEAAGMQIDHDFLNTIGANVSSGLITPQRGQALVKQYQLGVVKADIMKDPAKDLAESQTLKKLNSGGYGNLDLKEMNQADTMIKSKIKENQEIFVSQTLDNRVSIIKGIASGDVSWQNGDQISKIAAQDPKLGEALQSVFESNATGKPYAPEEDQNQNFADIVNKVFSSKTKEQVSDYLVNILHSAGEKNMSRDRMAILISAAEQRGKGLPTTDSSSDGTDDPKQSAIDRSVKGIKDFFEGAKDAGQKAGNVLTNFFKNMMGGKEPAQAQQEAMHSFNVKEYPWIATLPKEGAIKIDKNGNKVRIFPDGHYEETK